MTQPTSIPLHPSESPGRLAFLEAVHAASPVMAALLNCETETYEYIDPSVDHYLGYTAEDMILSNPAFLGSLLHPDDWKHARSGHLEAPLPFAGWSPRESDSTIDDGEIRLRHRDGRWRWFHVRRSVFDWTAEGAPRRVLAIFQDITSRRRAEDRFLEAEERFKAVMQHSLDVVDILDADGRVQYSSPGGESLHGVAVAGTIGRSLYPYVHAEDLDGVRQALSQILAHPDSPQRVQYRLATKARGWVWVETVAVNQLHNGAIHGILCSTRDISNRKRAEENLHRSEALLAEAQHLASLGSFEFDMATRESIWSDGLYRLLNRDPAMGPLRYMDLIQLIHPEDRAHWTAARKRLYSDSVPLRCEFRVIWRDRSVHHLSVKARPVMGSDGSYQRIVGAVQDISERKRIEEALRESMNAYREVTDCLPQAVFEADISGRLTFINQQGFTLFGYSEDDFERGLQALQMLVPEDRVRAAQAIAQAMAGGVSGHEYIALRKDGSRFPVIIHASPILRRGQPVGLRGAVVDITERKRSEEERAMMQERLRHSEKMEAIGQLAGGIAHDFNNHLSAIQGFAEILLERLTDPELVQFTEGIAKSCRHSAELTRQLLTFARRGQYLTVLVDLQGVVDEAVQILRHSIDKRILIRRTTDGQGTLVLGDPYELQNALMNLALNARDAMPNGGELTFSTEIRELDDLTCQRLPYDIFPGQFVQISVTDTGHGMDKAVQQRLFEPFFTTKELGKGTGLGLASVYGTVKSHRGAIMVYSEPGRGSCFKLFLPLAQLRDGELIEPMVASPEVLVSTMEPGSKRILVVEDEELVRQMLLVQLRHLGFQAVVAADGLAAVEAFRNAWREIDLVIMDLVMPNLSGIDTFRALRSINPSVKVVLSSGYSSDGEAQKILEEGASAFLQKPYQLGELSRTLTRIFAASVG